MLRINPKKYHEAFIPSPVSTVLASSCFLVAMTTGIPPHTVLWLMFWCCGSGRVSGHFPGRSGGTEPSSERRHGGGEAPPSRSVEGEKCAGVDAALLSRACWCTLLWRETMKHR